MPLSRQPAHSALPRPIRGTIAASDRTGVSQWRIPRRAAVRGTEDNAESLTDTVSACKGLSPPLSGLLWALSPPLTTSACGFVDQRPSRSGEKERKEGSIPPAFSAVLLHISYSSSILRIPVLRMPSCACDKLSPTRLSAWGLADRDPCGGRWRMKARSSRDLCLMRLVFLSSFCKFGTDCVSNPYFV